MPGNLETRFGAVWDRKGHQSKITSAIWKFILAFALGETAISLDTSKE
jgi:hypothetical protein